MDKASVTIVIGICVIRMDRLLTYKAFSTDYGKNGNGNKMVKSTPGSIILLLIFSFGVMQLANLLYIRDAIIGDSICRMEEI